MSTELGLNIISESGFHSHLTVAGVQSDKVQLANGGTVIINDGEVRGDPKLVSFSLFGNGTIFRIDELTLSVRPAVGAIVEFNAYGMGDKSSGIICGTISSYQDISIA